MTSSDLAGGRAGGRAAGGLAEVAPGTLPAAVRGALHLEPTGHGFACHRLPRWTRRQYADPAIGLAAAQGSGVRLELLTEASVVELELTFVRAASPPPRPAVVAAEVDGRPLPELAFDEGDLWADGPVAYRPGGPSTARFRLPDPVRPRRLTVWLPHHCAAELRALRADGPVTAAPADGPRWIHYGSSISHCGEAASPLHVWPVAVARALGLDLLNLGLAGQAQLDPFVARTIRDEPADLITLKLGTNALGTGSFNARTFGPAVHGFLDTVREGHPRTPVVVISPIHCADRRLAEGGTAPGEGRLTLDAIRRTLREVVAARSADDPRLLHLDGRRLLGPDDAARLADGLHPDDAGYRLIARRFTAWLRTDDAASASLPPRHTDG